MESDARPLSGPDHVIKATTIILPREMLYFARGSLSGRSRRVATWKRWIETSSLPPWRRLYARREPSREIPSIPTPVIRSALSALPSTRTSSAPTDLSALLVRAPRRIEIVTLPPYRKAHRIDLHQLRQSGADALSLRCFQIEPRIFLLRCEPSARLNAVSMLEPPVSIGDLDSVNDLDNSEALA
jgi:hypothetical protein